MLKPRVVVLFATLTIATLSAAAPNSSVRVTGNIQPVNSFVVQVPVIEGQGGNLTLTKLVPNGVTAHKGELLAVFDEVKELQALRDASAKYDDFSHQVEQKAAEHRNNSTKREADLEQAKADLAKADIEMRKGPILSDIDREKNQVNLDDAREHVASLLKAARYHEQAEAAESRILELQRDRQKVAVDRAKSNIARLELRAPLDGMVALQNVWRNNSMGHAEEGDQLWPGSPILRLFDPREMEVEVSIEEPDVAALAPGTDAIVHLDAFPELAFRAKFESASPVASSALGSPVKAFAARFRLLQSDPHLLPDLSAAVDIQLPKAGSGK
ncbi:MAG: HlyD family efflux transporter periplasmic adaptor subunit [Acidobacteriaceae bacterium]|nr:HlyD family efflux transporter periplasmic adaptor subunit [Acidobacteriaceae bacterium]